MTFLSKNSCHLNPLEGNCGFGLQIHVSCHEKTLHYTNRKAWLHMDEPAFLIARIKAKYLCVQNRNAYEAGLRTEYFSKIQDAKVIKMPHGWLGNGLEALITERPYFHRLNIQARIDVLSQRFNPRCQANLDKQLDLWSEHFTKNYADKVDNQKRYIFNKETNGQQPFVSYSASISQPLLSSSNISSLTTTATTGAATSAEVAVMATNNSPAPY